MLELFLESGRRGPVHLSPFVAGMKAKKSSSTKGNDKGTYKLVSYCPFCLGQGKDEHNRRVSVLNSTKTATCKSGHRFFVGSESRTEPQLRPETLED